MSRAGGRANNGEGVGPSGSGVVGVGVRTLNEAGTVSDWSREQVELFCISKLINCVLEPDEEFVFLDFHFAMRTFPMHPPPLPFPIARGSEVACMINGV